MKPEAWQENILPALSTTGRPGRADITGVPGGRNHYYRLVQSVLNPDEKNREVIERDWSFHHWTSQEVLTAEEIAVLSASMDEVSFDQEVNASFVSVSGRVYYGFSEENQRRLDYDPEKDLILTFDFNVSPGTANILQEGPDGTYCIGEVWIERDSNTEKVCDRIISDWQHHRGRVRCYGDASGGSRGTGRIQGNDWDIIRRRLSVVWPGIEIQVPNRNPEVRVRINSFNTRIKRGDGKRQFFIDPKKCPRTVTDLEGVVWKDNDIDKSDQWLTHLTDGLGYYFVSRFPLVSASFTRVNV